MPGNTVGMGDGTGQPDRELSRVQIGYTQADRAELDGPGAALAGLLAGRELDMRVPAEQMAMLPADGWRLISAEPARGGRFPREVLAAPLPPAGRLRPEAASADRRTRPPAGAGTALPAAGAAPPAGTKAIGGETCWALVSLAEKDGRWIVSADPGPLRVFPGQAARRRGLRLFWPQPAQEQLASAPISLTINLQNTRTASWRNECGDAARVAAWLLDADGQRIQQGPWVVFTGPSTLPDIGPGEVISLPAKLFTPDVQDLPAGRYELDAVLTHLNLRAEPGALLLRP